MKKIIFSVFINNNLKYDLSKGNYSDIYGNRITGTSGILKKVVFRGLNSRIE